MEGVLAACLCNKITAVMPVFLTEGQMEIMDADGPVHQCFMDVLQYEFFKINPEFSQRLDFHRSMQCEGQEVNQ